ncbi:MAG TPA: LacI family DNA-binding transcriptional regulator [Roseiarcus sp.]
MGNRPTLPDLARAAGVSVATVDRVLNGRHPVRKGTAERVLSAAEAIGFHGAPLLRRRVDAPTLTLGFLLQKPDAFYRRLGADIEAAAARFTEAKVRAIVEYEADISPSTTAERLLAMSERTQAIGVVSVDHPRVSEAIERLKTKGAPTFALISDLTAEARAGFIGRDNRKEGRTAAWIIAKAAARPGKIGIIVGSHRYLCQETAEISFRAYLREHAPAFQPLEPLVNLDDARFAHVATLELLARHPDLVGLYLCGGGTEGALAAAREETKSEPLAIVCNELTPETRAGLVDGVLSAVISTPTAQIADRAIEAMARSVTSRAPEAASQIVAPFELFLPTNI